MKILVTGAAGFIGAFTSKKLVEMGHEGSEERVVGDLGQDALLEFHKI